MGSAYKADFGILSPDGHWNRATREARPAAFPACDPSGMSMIAGNATTRPAATRRVRPRLDAVRGSGAFVACP